MSDNAYNDLSYSAKKTIQTSSFVLFFHPIGKGNSRFHFRFQFSYYIENEIASSGFVSVSFSHNFGQDNTYLDRDG